MMAIASWQVLSSLSLASLPSLNTFIPSLSPPYSPHVRLGLIPSTLSSPPLPAATVGVVTETNAERAIEELKAYEADVATVLRSGRWTVLPASELVPGDVVEVAVGAKVPADVRIVGLLSSTLRVDQASQGRGWVCACV